MTAAQISIITETNNHWLFRCKWIWKRKRKKIIIFKINLVSLLHLTIWRKKELLAENQATIRKSSNHIIKRYGPSFQRVTKRSLIVLIRNGADVKEVALVLDTSSRTSVVHMNCIKYFVFNGQSRCWTKWEVKNLEAKLKQPCPTSIFRDLPQVDQEFARRMLASLAQVFITVRWSRN